MSAFQNTVRTLSKFNVLDPAQHAFAKALAGPAPDRPQNPPAGFAPGPSATTAVPVAPPPTMPTADDAQVQAAQRRQLLEETQRRGRASTILTTPNFAQTLG